MRLAAGFWGLPSGSRGHAPCFCTRHSLPAQVTDSAVPQFPQASTRRRAKNNLACLHEAPALQEDKEAREWPVKDWERCHLPTPPARLPSRQIQLGAGETMQEIHHKRPLLLKRSTSQPCKYLQGLCFSGQDPSAGKHQEGSKEEPPTSQLEEEQSHSTILQNRGTSVPSPPALAAQPRCSSLHPTTPPRTAPTPQLHASFRSSKPPGPTRKRAGVQRTQEEKQGINSSPFLLLFGGGAWQALRRTTTNPRSKPAPQYGNWDAPSTPTAADSHQGASQGCSQQQGQRRGERPGGSKAGQAAAGRRRESPGDSAAPVPVNYTTTLLCRAGCKISQRITHGLVGVEEKLGEKTPLLTKKCTQSSFPQILGDAKRYQPGQAAAWAPTGSRAEDWPFVGPAWSPAAMPVCQRGDPTQSRPPCRNSLCCSSVG
nr:translation initiation factor IF-2-like isoform X3 [Anser cygnoides]